MKKFAMAVVTATLLSTVHGDTCASSFTGFYAGLQAGVNVFASNSTQSPLQGETKRTQSAQTFIGGLFLGYGMGVGSCTYVGGELYGNLGNNNVRVALDNSFNYTISNTYNLGAKLRLGYTVSQQAMVFLGLGVENSRWQTKYTSNTGTRDRKKTTNSTVFAPSVGAEMFVNKNLFVRGEYTLVMGPKIKLLDSNGDPVPAAGQTVKFNANQHRFALGAGYKF